MFARQIFSENMKFPLDSFFCNYMQPISLLPTVSTSDWYPSLSIKRAVSLLNMNHLIWLSNLGSDLGFSHLHHCEWMYIYADPQPVTLCRYKFMFSKWIKNIYQSPTFIKTKFLLTFVSKYILKIPLFFSFQEVLIISW